MYPCLFSRDMAEPDEGMRHCIIMTWPHQYNSQESQFDASLWRLKEGDTKSSNNVLQLVTMQKARGVVLQHDVNNFHAKSSSDFRRSLLDSEIPLRSRKQKAASEPVASQYWRIYRPLDPSLHESGLHQNW